MTPEELPQRIAETGEMLSRLIRRRMENPKAPNRLPGLLKSLSGALWPGSVAAALRTPQQADGQIYRMVDEAIASALRDGTRIEIVADLYNQLPRETVALQETALEVALQTVVAFERLGRIEIHPVPYLVSLNNYVGRLLQMGRIAEAETAGRRAVSFADDSRYSTLPDMPPARASALENIAHVLREMGRPAEALAATEAARSVYEQLSREKPEFKKNLATCLNNHIAVLTELERHEEAVKIGREAAKLLKEMVQDRPYNSPQFAAEGLQAFEDNLWPTYAICLIALTSELEKTGRREEGLHAAEESVWILTRLAEESQEFSPLLAQAQANHAMALDGLGRYEEALSAVSPALDTVRRLESLRPGHFTYYVAHVLRQESLYLARLGRNREALAPGQEAVELYRQVEQQRPGLVRTELEGTIEQVEIIRARMETAGQSEAGL